MCRTYVRRICQAYVSDAGGTQSPMCLAERIGLAMWLCTFGSYAGFGDSDIVARD